MDKKSRLKVSLALIILFFFLISHASAYNLSPQVRAESLKKEQKTDKRRSEAEETKKEVEKEEEKTALETHVYTQVEFSSIVGEILVNPEYSGRITTVRALLKTGPPRDNPVVNVRETSDGWEKVIVSESESDAVGLIATGRRGSLKISLSNGEAPAKVDKLQPLSDLIISFGQLSATLITPEITISEPSGFEIGILDYKKNKFINGDIIAIKGNQIAVKFQGLDHTLVNKDGMIRVSLKEPGGSFLGADLKAWGYNISVSDADIGKPAPIKAEVFGLPPDAKLKFTFESLSGQNITPSTKVLTVKEINQGTPLAKIVTSIPGAQPLSVLVEKVD